jgi:hypothetical protein
MNSIWSDSNGPFEQHQVVRLPSSRKGDIMSKLPRILILTLTLILLSFPATLQAQVSTAAFGPETFARETTRPQTIVKTFPLQNLTGPFTISVQNGEGKRGRVSSATISLNGVLVVGPNEFNKQIDRIEKEINLAQQNTLAVQVRSEPGSSIIVTVNGFGPPPISPIQNVTINPDAIFVGEPGYVTIRARVPYDPSTSTPVVALQRIDIAGNVVSSEGNLTDDGNLSNGDEILGDGIFSIRRLFFSQTEQRIRLRINFQQESATVNSDVFFLDVFTHLTNDQLDTILNIQKVALQNYNSLVGSLGPQGALAAVLSQLQQNPNVLQAGTSQGGTGLWMLYSSGILGSLSLNPAGTRGGGFVSSQPALDSLFTRSSRYNTIPSLAATCSLMNAAPAVAAPDEKIKNRKAIVLGAQHSDPAFGSLDDAPLIFQTLKDSTCPKFDITYLLDGAVTVDVIKTLNQYGVIAITSHGDTYYNGILSLWQDKFGWNSFFGQAIFLTGQKATVANKSAYEIDLKKGRLVIDADFYAVLPSFISHYASTKYPNSVVYLGSCRSTFNDSMANAFLNSGAKTYLGYSDYVDSGFAQTAGSGFFQKFVADSTVMNTGQAFTPGQHDSHSPPVYFQLRGSTTLALPPSDLDNGGFENGNLGAWSPFGDGRVLTQLGQFTPTGGSYMGVVSTGLGFTTSSGSIEQKICLPSNAQSLEFRWNFNSEEFIEYCGSIYQDFFKVEIITDSGTTTLFYRKVDDLCPQVFHTGLVFDRGDVWSTGWLSQSIDISTIAAANLGKSVTIRFSAGDVGDSVYDTAILLDEIKVVSP